MKNPITLFMFYIVLVASSSATGQGQSEKAPVNTVCNFARLQDWKLNLPAGVRIELGPASTARLVWQTNSSNTVTAVLQLASAVVMGDDARRAGLWFYVEQPMDLSGAWLTFTDAAGRTFHYRLPIPPRWALGWRYVDTFPFGVNETGKLHPDVGQMIGQGEAVPRRPLQLTGLRLEARQPADGLWLLDRIESDSVTRGDGRWRWALNLPGLHRWMTTSLLRDGEPPCLLAGHLLPTDGDVEAHWSVQAGFQGLVVSEGNEHIQFKGNDVAAEAKRVSLGELPVGTYNVEVTLRPADPRNSTPDHWQRLVWQAEGRALWDNQAAHEGRRSLHGQKVSGKGYAGWRQTVAVTSPGTYHFRVFERGNCHAEAQVHAFDAKWKNIKGGITLRFKPSDSWQSAEGVVTFGPEAQRLHVNLVAIGNGDAWFDDVVLEKDNANIVQNGDAESGKLYEHKEFPLIVIQSPVSPKPQKTAPLSVAPGESIEIPLPGWPADGGTRKWEILDKAAQVLATGDFQTESVSWRPPAPGVFQFHAIRLDGGVLIDEERRLVGCRTPLAQIGPAEFIARDRVATDKDLFGPGKNYFTWAAYEMNFNQPDYFKTFCDWADDGRAAGFDLFRVRADWAALEPLPGVFDFALVDRCIAAVAERGGHVVLEPVFNPAPWVEIHPQLDSEGRADLWAHGNLGRPISSVWTPGLLDAVRRFVEAIARHYRNNPTVVGYHFWGLPGSADWTYVDKPWWGQVTDYSPDALDAFHRWSGGKYETAPLPSPNWAVPDLRSEWRAWTEFKRLGSEKFFCDSVITPLRALDDRRPVAAYYGFESASPRLARSARTQGWFRHTGGCDLYYQTTMLVAEALNATAHPWPQEVGGMTPTPGELEQATWQISAFGGLGLNWNYYWREGIRTGHWFPDRNEALSEWQRKWAPVWRELRDASLSQSPDVAVVKTWSTMQYGLRTFFPHRLNDYCTKFAATLYRDHLWPTWFSENCDLASLPQQKLVFMASGAARVLPREMADALAEYVRAGGRLVLFPESGQWVIEEPDHAYALLERLDWRWPMPQFPNAVSSEVGNSGLPASQAASTVTEAKVAPDSEMLRPLQVLPLKSCVQLKDVKAEVHARFPDGSPAVIAWPCGRGQVVFFAGTPDWENSAGLFAALYGWAGGRRDVGTSAPSILINHFVKDGTHYVLLHRAPDDLNPRAPTLDRAKLRSMPTMSAKFQVCSLPEGVWRVLDLTEDGKVLGSFTSSQLSAGLPVTLYLAQTKVFRLEREK